MNYPPQFLALQKNLAISLFIRFFLFILQNILVCC